MSPAKKSSSSRKKTSRTAKKTTARKTSRRKPAARKTSKTVRKKTAARATGDRKRTAKSTKSTAKKKTTSRKPKSRAKRPAAATKASPPVARKRPAAKKPVARKRAARPAKLDAKALADIRRTLESERSDLQEREAELEASSFDTTQSDMTGEAGFDEDFADAGSATFERERDLSIRNNIRDLIDQINRAIGRIDEGTYGTCERCGRPIDASRLRALPHALLCMDCKRREERAR